MLHFIPNIPKPKLTFNEILEQAKNSLATLTDSDQLKLKKDLNHGLGNLQSKKELDYYLASYGAIHQAKLLRAFTHLPNKIWSEDKVSLIDYGCGQGLAEMVFSDFINSKWKGNDFVRDITLIEPSKVALQQGLHYVSSFFPKARLIQSNKCMENLSFSTMKPMCKTCLHIFSNVVDIPDFPIEQVAENLINEPYHNKIVVCVSPFYPESARGKRINDLGNMLNGFYCYYTFQKHIDEWQNPYSCQIKIFVNNWY